MLYFTVFRPSFAGTVKKKLTSGPSYIGLFLKKKCSSSEDVIFQKKRRLALIKEIFLSTWDNPYNPYTQEEQWRRHDDLFGDSMKYYGINCPSMQARYAYTSDDLSDADNDIAIEEGIDEIIKLDPFGIYRKVIIEVDDPEEDSQED